MHNEFHHLALFVSDMEKSLRLFCEVLGMNLLWRKGPETDPQLGKFLGLARNGVAAEIAYLQLAGESLGLELVCLEDQVPREAPPRLGAAACSILSYFTDDPGGLYQKLESEGCRPWCEDLRVTPPEGPALTVRGFETPDGARLEIISPAA